eukprot:1217536-Pleurochrysis_carterae.AAC.1
MRTCGALALRFPGFLVTLSACPTPPSRAPASKPPRRRAQPPRPRRSPTVDYWYYITNNPFFAQPPDGRFS